ncbi:hypothetical protein [Streptomyces neyagawaensis]|uniref:hypothetical protein n=1 Tax=Streptomyces neyagawaensis TaxID=42238 RepID=UPI0012FE96E4|nr:hypothetical protein [Streptomyces neyagawaensis]MCL6732198.1 hypothetical protein [Streptomyces neyagawaensis]MDE1682307.1 hypothetical protein [Streptomyces neyagawaensis]
MKIAGWAWSDGAPSGQPIDDRSSEVSDRSDTVLDVTRTVRWSSCLGNETTVVPVPGALHDVLLSRHKPANTPAP